MSHTHQGELTPSTHWKEVPSVDEAERFASYAKQFEAIQARKSQQYGVGRALHRKQIVAATASLEVLAQLPPFAAHGLFATPGNFDVLVRLSNGGMDKASDRRPDIRGFSFRVLGVKGDSALNNGPAKSQDFTLINQEKFAFAGSDEFVGFVVAASGGAAALVKHLIQRYGLLGGPRRLVQMAKSLKKPFSGFATETMYSSVPMACGPYAVRVRLMPSPTNGAPVIGADADWGADFSARMAKQELSWELQLQPFVNETLTPIEDASVNWSSPYVTVARLTVHKQDAASSQGKALTEEVESSVFDPWQALLAHRPLGDVQRARKVIYFQSQQGRGAA